MLWDNIKSHMGSFLLWLALCAVFAAAFIWYGLPLEGLIYGGIAAVVLLIIAWAVSFSSYKKKRLKLKKLAEEICSAKDLPKPKNGTEAEYTAIIRRVLESKEQAENKALAERNALTEFCTLWSEQIKAPIAAIKPNLTEDSSSAENLLSVEQYCEMVLCYLRTEPDYQGLSIKENDLDAILKQAVQKYSAQFIRRRLNLVFRPVKLKVTTDEGLLLFAVEQMISNAVKRTQNGGVKIYCEEPLTLCIRDTGTALTAETLAHMFDARNDVGLYLSRRICNKLGHKISAENAEGGGTVIRIEL